MRLGLERELPASTNCQSFPEVVTPTTNAQAVDSLDLTNEFGRALSELKLGPEAVDTPKLQKFIKKLCPSYDYPSVENMNQVYKMLKLSTETFPTPTENHASQ